MAKSTNMRNMQSAPLSVAFDARDWTMVTLATMMHMQCYLHCTMSIGRLVPHRGSIAAFVVFHRGIPLNEERT